MKLKLRQNTIYYVDFGTLMVNDVEAKIKNGKKVSIRYYGDLKLWGVTEI